MLQARQQIGRMDREVTFIQPVIVDGDSNEDKVTNWEEISTAPTVAARKLEQRGNEAVIADRQTYFATGKWEVRYRTDLNTRMRLVYKTQVFEILSIQDVGETRGRYLTILTNLLDNIYFT